jgi:hypothetical protein
MSEDSGSGRTEGGVLCFAWAFGLIGGLWFGWYVQPLTHYSVYYGSLELLYKICNGVWVGSWCFSLIGLLALLASYRLGRGFSFGFTIMSAGLITVIVFAATDFYGGQAPSDLGMLLFFGSTFVFGVVGGAIVCMTTRGYRARARCWAYIGMGVAPLVTIYWLLMMRSRPNVAAMMILLILSTICGGVPGAMFGAFFDRKLSS